VKVLLDENFPLGLVRALRADGLHAEHIITIGWRGASDTRIRERLQDDQVVFLTQDEDFLFGETLAAVVLISRVKQTRPLRERIDIWHKAVQQLAQKPRAEKLFELTDEGLLLPWREVSDGG
jgi:hypothetical protein